MASAVFAMLFVLAPVDQRTAEFRWDLRGGPAASVIPLSSYRPIAISVQFGCVQLAALPPNGALLGTEPAPGATGPTATGLWIGRVQDQLRITVQNTTVLATPLSAASLSAAPCAITVRSDARATTVAAGAQVLGSLPGDHRPTVAGFFTDLPAATSTDGLSAQLTADTRFETSPTPAKIAAGALAGLCLVGALVAAWRADRRSPAGRRVRVWPAPGTRRRTRGGRAPDAVVAAGLLVWAVIGPLSVDDGYTTTMVRDAARSGYVGGYHHWLNTPEAPFGWFYSAFGLWSQVSGELLWLRVPSVVMGILSWLLLSRFVLPRVLPGSRRTRWVGWLAAVGFLGAWLPYCVGLRPEPYVVVGMLLTWCLVERAVATRRVLPLGVAIVVAGLTFAITPTGMVAALPVLIAAPRLWRAGSARPDLRGLPVIGLIAGCGLSAALVMFADQTPGAVAAGTAVRTAIGPNLPWQDELVRYQTLLTSPLVEGAMGRRVPVLLMLLAVAVWAVVAVRGRRVPGAHAAAAPRFVLLTGLALAALALTPTKWTHHFGGFAGCATVMIVLVAWTGTRVVRSAAHRAGLLAVTLAVMALCLSGAITWWSASGEAISWGDRAPAVAGVELWKVALAGAAVCALAGLAGMRLPSVAVVLTPFLVVTLTLQTYGLAHAVAHPGYTVGGDLLGSITGGRCTLARSIRIEPSPSADVLAPVAGPAGVATLTGSMALGVPAAAFADPYDPAARQWQADGGRPGGLVTGWYPVASASSVVVTASGSPDASAVAEFAVPAGDGFTVTSSVPLALSGAPADIRLVAPTTAGGGLVMRLHGSLAAGPPDGRLGIGAPRVPRLVPLATAFPADAPALVDWPVAELMPCQRLASLAGGVAEMPAFVMTDGKPLAEGLSPASGGPFATVAAVADLRPVPTFLDGNPGSWSPKIFRVVPRQADRPPLVTTGTTRTTAWTRGPALLP